MKFITYDLGTGGVKASLYDEHLNTLGKSFIAYTTSYPHPNMHEQRPEDWWKGVQDSTSALMSHCGTSADEIGCVALSGHSCVAVPLDNHLQLLTEYVPIWSDTRAEKETDDFFTRIDREKWYMITGNGFPAPCYSIFKLMWLKDNKPDVYAKIYKVVGSKDYINLRMTGRVMTDFSYASSTGVYDLKEKTIREDLLDATGISRDIFPEIVPSHTIVGSLRPEAAASLGLTTKTLVACGGVDNACMALGTVGDTDGAVYVSLGSSSWIPVNSREPVLDAKTKPYVFAHIADNMYTSAYSIFAGGSSFAWIKEELCKDLPEEGIYAEMDKRAAKVPVGSRGVLFNPSLAGGTSQDKSIHIHGAFLGLHLGTTRDDMIRAAMEGIALNLKYSLELLKKKVPVSDELTFTGGGSKSSVWMQMFADIFNLNIIKKNIDQDAASFGAAAICKVACGEWNDYSRINTLVKITNRFTPNVQACSEYEKLYGIFLKASDMLSEFGDIMDAEMQEG